MFGDVGLLGVGHVHDHAALEHFGQAHFHAPLILGCIPLLLLPSMCVS